MKGKTEEQRKEAMDRYLGEFAKPKAKEKEVTSLDIGDAAKVEMINEVIKKNQEAYAKRLKDMALEYEMNKGADNLVLR